MALPALAPAAPPLLDRRRLPRDVKIRFLIANAYGVGGTTRTVYNLAGELAKRHDVEIVSLQKHREFPVFTVPPGVRLRPLVDRSKRMRQADRRRTGLVPRAKVKLKYWARSQPSLLIHRGEHRYDRFNLFTDLRLTQFLRSVDDGVLIATRAGLNLAVARLARPTVVRIGQEHLNLSKYKKGIREAYRKYYPRLDAYVTLTERDAVAYKELLGGQTRVLWIPNGIPKVSDARSDTTSKIVVAAGRLAPQKGFDRLIPAWAKVADAYPDWELRIFGGGKQREPLRRQIQELGLDGSARLMGYTDRLPEEMAAAAFYVMSSRFEGFPMVLLEAMECGLPVVSYDCPTGPRDLITVGKDGFLVPNGDIDGLAAAMIDMIELGDGRKAFGAAALEKSAQYEVSAVAARWEDLLQELVDARARGGR
jgi:glycosyltransferase involved in cell wall biosynthesis